MTNATLRGKPDAGNPHVRFDEGEVASAKPRRGSLLYKNVLFALCVLTAVRRYRSALILCLILSAASQLFAGKELTTTVERYDEGVFLGSGTYSLYEPYGDRTMEIDNEEPQYYKISELHRFVGWSASGRLLRWYEVVDPAVTRMDRTYIDLVPDRKYFFSKAHVVFTLADAEDCEGSAITYEEAGRLIAEGRSSELAMWAFGKHDSFHCVIGVNGERVLQEEWWTLDEEDYSAAMTLYVRSGTGKFWEFQMGNVVGHKPDLSIWGYKFAKKYSLPAIDFKEGDSYHFTLDFKSDCSGDYLGTENWSTQTVDVDLPWLSAKAVRQKWNNDQIALKWRYETAGRGNYENKFSVWRSRTTGGNPDEWELLAKDISGYEFVTNEQSKGYSFCVTMKECLPYLRYGGDVPYTKNGGSGWAQVYDEYSPPYVVTMEPVDGERLLAESTDGSDWFWQEVQKDLNLAVGMYQKRRLDGLDIRLLRHRTDKGPAVTIVFAQFNVAAPLSCFDF